MHVSAHTHSSDGPACSLCPCVVIIPAVSWNGAEISCFTVRVVVRSWLSWRDSCDWPIYNISSRLMLVSGVCVQTFLHTTASPHDWLKLWHNKQNVSVHSSYLHVQQLSVVCFNVLRFKIEQLILAFWREWLILFENNRKDKISEHSSSPYIDT